MNDAVLTYHTNPYTCGVAKFNHALATRLGVPCQSVHARQAVYPIYSLKIAETMMAPRWAPPLPAPYDLILHDVPDPNRNTRELEWIRDATRAFGVNPDVVRGMQQVRPDVDLLWCPSLIGVPPRRANRTILTFGMAHKFVAQQGTTVAASTAGGVTPTLTQPFHRLKTLLNAECVPYTILVSMGVHEGSPWDDALDQSTEAMVTLFGAERVEVLGFLSDAALHHEILRATACAAFYDPALRANNTTAWAVLERNCPLITNLDVWSPPVRCWDINHLTRWPAEFDIQAYPPAIEGYTWSDLVQRLQGIPCAN
jgi:hypothetical protein